MIILTVQCHMRPGTGCSISKVVKLDVMTSTRSIYGLKRGVEFNIVTVSWYNCAEFHHQQQHVSELYNDVTEQYCYIALAALPAFRQKDVTHDVATMSRTAESTSSNLKLKPSS